MTSSLQFCPHTSPCPMPQALFCSGYRRIDPGLDPEAGSYRVTPSNCFFWFPFIQGFTLLLISGDIKSSSIADLAWDHMDKNSIQTRECYWGNTSLSWIHILPSSPTWFLSAICLAEMASFFLHTFLYNYRNFIYNFENRHCFAAISSFPNTVGHLALLWPSKWRHISPVLWGLYSLI